MIEPATDEQDAAVDNAEQFLVGNLMDAARRRFCTLAVPWHKLSEQEQSRVLQNLAEDVRRAVSRAIVAIASHERITFRAEVKGVNFKIATEVAATLNLMNTPQSHALADVAGGFVTVVIEDMAALLDIPESATAGEPDSPPLFDRSTGEERQHADA